MKANIFVKTPKKAVETTDLPELPLNDVALSSDLLSDPIAQSLEEIENNISALKEISQQIKDNAKLLLGVTKMCADGAVFHYTLTAALKGGGDPADRVNLIQAANEWTRLSSGAISAAMS